MRVRFPATTRKFNGRMRTTREQILFCREQASKLHALANHQAETSLASRLDAIAAELEAFAEELEMEEGRV